jgi:ribosomal protein S12 methylthiotransferase accessory factor YcaO
LREEEAAFGIRRHNKDGGLDVDVLAVRWRLGRDVETKLKRAWVGGRHLRDNSELIVPAVNYEWGRILDVIFSN